MQQFGHLHKHYSVDKQIGWCPWVNKEGYFDNWFSSCSLLKALKDQGILATGTIRADRLGKDFKIIKKEIKQEKRRLIQCCYEGIGSSVISWNDGDPVIVLSRMHSDLLHTSWSTEILLKNVTLVSTSKLHCLVQ